MSERPIIFSTPMVRAILEGRKTQTRRVLKPQPSAAQIQADDFHIIHNCGDLLWVRETWAHTGHGVWTVSDARMASLNGKVIYRADDDTPGSWFPSIHMPKEFARIFLKVIGVRVQHLQEISEEDAKAEGVTFECLSDRAKERFSRMKPWPEYCRPLFACLWGDLHGTSSWAENSFVYALTFERIDHERKGREDR